MSLHVELSEEAAQRLQSIRRNNTISSMVIALLVVVLIGLVFGLVALKTIVKETPTFVTYQANAPEETQTQTRKVQPNLNRKPSSPSNSIAKVIVANTVNTVAVPVPDQDVTTPSLEFGDGDGFGSGWGDGDGSGFAGIPGTMSKRCSKQDRLQRLAENGGNPECEEAVVRALDWLQRTQNPDGSWCPRWQPAMTGLALLAYLGHCETPQSEKYGETVLKAITWLVDLGMRQEGKLNMSGNRVHMVYEHSIATYALAEAATFCKQIGSPVPNLNEVTAKAGQFIIDRQHDTTGGWDYSYTRNSPRGGDVSVSAWHIQALKACSHTGLAFKDLDRAMRKAERYIKDAAYPNGGFAYEVGKDRGGYRTLSGAGMLSLQMLGEGSSPQVSRSADYIRKNSKLDYNTARSDLYGHYYEVQAMMNSGGDDWKWYNDMFRDQLLRNQNPDGSWKELANGGKISGHVTAILNTPSVGPWYRTTLATLMLEVYYRFLPGTGAK